MKDDNTKYNIVNTRGQVTGFVRGQTYYRSLAENHILHTPPAIAISLDIIEQLKNLDVERVEFTNRQTGTIYRSSLAHFISQGLHIDRGAGVQIALPLAGFAIEGRVQIPAKAEPARTRQLSFGGLR